MRRDKKTPPAVPGDSAPSGFINPWDNVALMKYLEQVRKWHGYIKFLGLPHLRDNPDVPIDRLFVEPRLSDQPIHPDRPVDEWPERQSALTVLEAEPRLVLLGDPGSGKSTLVSWLAWQFARPVDSAYTMRLGPLIPFPFILRELGLTRDLTWDSLLEKFLAHPMAKPLGGPKIVKDLIRRGQALLMFDGFDEIGDVEIRKELRFLFFLQMKNYYRARWLITSRIVGYDEASFQKIQFKLPYSDKPITIDTPPTAHYYASPFSDEQITQFAENWYHVHEAAEERREERTRNFISAIHSNKNTQRLARVPNLLAMMALIHRVRAQLPHGRAKLYDDIAEAYLHSIDEFRGLRTVDYELEEKRNWLARVGFELQARRGDSDKTDEILVTGKELTAWIAAAMAEMGRSGDKAQEEAAAFVDFIARRSGLLLPRGENRFAFAHLSFQEYFAACYLVSCITRRRWLPDYGEMPDAGTQSGRFTPGDLRGYADSPLWRETLLLTFELLSTRPPWPEDLANWVFGDKFQELSNFPGEWEQYYERTIWDARPRKGAATLLAELAMDPYSGFSEAMRKGAMTACWRWEIGTQQKVPRERRGRISPVVADCLLQGSSDLLEISLRCLEEVFEKERPLRLRMSGGGTLDFLTTANPNAQLKELVVDSSPRLSDLTPLSRLTGLEELGLVSCPGVTDLSPITTLTGLTYLRLLNCAGVTDLSPVGGLTRLVTLSLGYCSKLTDIGPLRSLTGLRVMSLFVCPGVTDLGPLSALTGLTELILFDCPGVTDLGPLSALTGLTDLRLSICPGVTDLGPLKSLTGLVSLRLHDISSEISMEPLCALIGLRELSIDESFRETAVLEKLSEHPNLKISYHIRLDAE